VSESQTVILVLSTEGGPEKQTEESERRFIPSDLDWKRKNHVTWFYPLKL